MILVWMFSLKFKLSFYVNYECPFDCVKFIVKLISVNALATAHCVLLQDYCITKSSKEFLEGQESSEDSIEKLKTLMKVFLFKN